ncbi:MAG: YveK family protein [Anaerolineae bacterium]
MELRRYLVIFWKRCWIIILVALVAAISAYVFSKIQTPIYKASVQISINPARPDWGLAQTAKIMLRNYTVNMTTHTWAQRVIDALELDISTAKLLSMVTASSDDSNLTIQIDVKHQDPATAQDIAWTWANFFVEWRAKENLELPKEDRVGASTLDTPNVSLFSPKTKINVLAGGLVGAILGGLIVLFLEWLESDVIRTPEDVERHVGVVVLGSIPTISAEEATPGFSRRWLNLKR